MSYTEQQLAGMNDHEINWAMCELLGGQQLMCLVGIDMNLPSESRKNAFVRISSLGIDIFNACGRWDIAGPLMVKYGIATVAENGKIVGATNNSQEYYEPFGSTVHQSNNPNPLRAICEVVLKMEEHDNETK